MDTVTIDSVESVCNEPESTEQPLRSTAFSDLDHLAGANLSKITMGFSPAAIILATLDWSLHWADSPGKRLQTALEAYVDSWKFAAFAARSLFENENSEDKQPDLVTPAADDYRFRDDHWQQWPFRLLSQGFLLSEKWWGSATQNVLGVSPHHQHQVSFAARQWLDVFSPSNFPLTNPEVLKKTWQSGGRNLLDGAGNLIEDTARNLSGKPPAGTEQFQVGKNLAITPGKIIFQNHLIELIQYASTTDQVYAEPVFIVPAWIMKYYILDLRPENSLIRYLVSQGHTVFCISWRNIAEPDQNISLDDYRRDGVMAALQAIETQLPQRSIHTVGYCLGGTLLSIAAAAMARSKDNRLATISLFAAQTDFTEPGELKLFIDHSQIGILESMMWAHGVLDSRQMAGAFQILQSNDLVWSRLVHDYLMGERKPITDLVAWNADGTRMPYRMHSEYLRSLFLNNDLAAGRMRVDGQPVAIQNIRIPIFAVGTESDRIAPWRSVFKIHYLADNDITFLLTNGGHNAGIVSEPGHPHRHFALRTKLATDPDLSADEWVASTPINEGSWWPAWVRWLQQHSSDKLAVALETSASAWQALPDAPGSYVLEH